MENAEGVIEEEALRYIGGYIAKKFSMKYPDLGDKNLQTRSKNESWIDCVSLNSILN